MVLGKGVEVYCCFMENHRTSTVTTRRVTRGGMQGCFWVTSACIALHFAHRPNFVAKPCARNRVNLHQA